MYAALRIGIHGEKTASLCKDDYELLLTFGKNIGLVGTGKTVTEVSEHE